MFLVFLVFPVDDHESIFEIKINSMEKEIHDHHDDDDDGGSIFLKFDWELGELVNDALSSLGQPPITPDAQKVTTNHRDDEFQASKSSLI